MSEELPPQAAGWEPLLPWQQATAATLLADRERWPHALLLAGRSGVGKRVLALNFARALLCERPQSDGGACGACPSCAYVVAGAHPDLRVLGGLVLGVRDAAAAGDDVTVRR